MNIIDTLLGDLNEKKRYRANEKRAKDLPTDYAEAYKHIRNYLWSTSGILTIDPLVSLVDMLEEAAASGRSVTDITGPDVAAFAEAFGARGMRIQEPDQIAPTLKKALATEGPVAIGIPVDYRDNHRLMEIVHPQRTQLRSTSA